VLLRVRAREAGEDEVEEGVQMKEELLVTKRLLKVGMEGR